MMISIYKSTKEPSDIKRDLFPKRVRERTMLRFKNVKERRWTLPAPPSNSCARYVRVWAVILILLSWVYPADIIVNKFWFMSSFRNIFINSGFHSYNIDITTSM